MPFVAPTGKEMAVVLELQTQRLGYLKQRDALIRLSESLFKELDEAFLEEYHLRQEKHHLCAELLNIAMENGYEIPGETSEWRDCSSDPPNLSRRYGSVEEGHSRDETSADLIISGSTTLVVRNIPARYTKERLLLEWPPDGTYDFLYLPFNFRLGKPAGHAILNFTCNEAALSFYYRWHRQRLSPTSSEPKLKIIKAEVQGLEENLRHRVNSKIDRITHLKYVPSVFIRGQEVPFAELVRSMGIQPM